MLSKLNTGHRSQRQRNVDLAEKIIEGQDAEDVALEFDISPQRVRIITRELLKNAVAESVRSLPTDDVDSTFLTDEALSQRWVWNGGTAFNGQSYKSSGNAVPFGQQGSPLIPRLLWSLFEGLSIPANIQDIFGFQRVPASCPPDYWNNIALESMSWAQRTQVMNLLKVPKIPRDLTVIPPGVSIKWLLALPAPNSIRMALMRITNSQEDKYFVESPILSGDLLAQWFVGHAILMRFMSVLESVEVHDPEDHEPDSSDGFHYIAQSHVSELVRDISPFVSDLRDMVQWARHETEIKTVGELFGYLSTSRGCGIPAELPFENLLNLKLNDLDRTPVLHPYEILEGFTEQFQDKYRVVLESYLLHQEPELTPNDLKYRLGVSRQRIGQIVDRLRSDISEFIKSSAGAPIRWRAEQIKNRVGIACSVDDISSLLKVPDGMKDYRKFLLEVAGDFFIDGNWVVSKNTLKNDPVRSLKKHVDSPGYVNMESLSGELSQWGLDRKYHKNWMLRHERVKEVGNRLVYLSPYICDRLALSLEDIGYASTIQEIMAHAGERKPLSRVREAIHRDTRFVKAGMSHWALRSWDTEHYLGTQREIEKMLREEGMPLNIEVVARRLREKYDIPRATVISYSYAPKFVKEDNIIRLRDHDVEPFYCSMKSMQRSSGVFFLDEGRVGLMVNIRDKVLTGNNESVSGATFAIFGIPAPHTIWFTDETGHELCLMYRDSSIGGPAFKSLRELSQKLGCRNGDILTLVLDYPARRFAAHKTDLEDHEPSWELVSRLTGILPPANRSELAKAICSKERDLLRSLTRRGDTILLDLIKQL